MPLEKMKRIFCEEAKVQRWLTVEAALAKVEASLGVIPKDAADEIASKAKVELIDEEERQREIKRTQHYLVATLRCLQRLCRGNTGEYVHWGPTTQDILDTADALAVKEAHNVIFQAVREIEANLLEIADREADTVMAGRTHGQHAVPLTLGFKVAVWIREIRRHIQRLKESRERLFVGQLNGAVGTYASFGDKGPLIEKLTMKELGLKAPDISWQAARDRSAEFAWLVGMVASTVGKIANEFSNLGRTELAEWEEAVTGDKIASSTMPGKLHLLSWENSLTLAKRLKYYTPLALEGMIVEHERGGAGWYLARDSLAEMCLLMGDLLTRMIANTKNVKVNRQRMVSNMELSKGLLFSEAVMLELGRSIGKQTAHKVTADLAKKALEQGITLKEALLASPIASEHLTPRQIDDLFDPYRQVKVCSKITRDMVAITLKEREKD